LPEYHTAAESQADAQFWCIFLAMIAYGNQRRMKKPLEKDELNAKTSENEREWRAAKARGRTRTGESSSTKKPPHEYKERSTIRQHAIRNDDASRPARESRSDAHWRTAFSESNANTARPFRARDECNYSNAIQMLKARPAYIHLNPRVRTSVSERGGGVHP